MQKGLRTKNLKFFTGLQNYEESNSVPENKFYSARNARFSGKVVSSKPGYQLLGDSGVGGTKVQGIFEYSYWNGTTTAKKLLRIYNYTFEEFDETTQTWLPIATVWPNLEDSYVDGVNYNNTIYLVNPLTGTGDGVGKISNSTFSVIANSPRGFAIESWVERLWVIGDPTSPNGLIASRAALASAPSNIEDFTTGTILELIGKGGRNVALRMLENQLFVFKEDAIFYNTADRIAAGNTPFLELSRTGGAVNQKSTIVVENDVWFVSTNRGIEVRSLGVERNLGTNPRTKDLTSIIQRTMDILDPVQDNPVMSYKDKFVQVHLKTKGSPTNNITIGFDYDSGGWTVDRGKAVNVNTVWGEALVFGEDATGQVYQDNLGYTENGASYRFQADTPFMDDTRPDISKRARYILFKGKQSYTQPVTIRLYRDDNYNTYSTYVIPSPSARGVSQSSYVNDGQQGASQRGDAIWGGTGEDDEIPLYKTEYLISVDRRSNMYALGLDAEINGGKVVCEQLILKVIDDNENYKRANL